VHKPPVADLANLYEVRFDEAERAAKDKIWQVLCRDYFSRYVADTDTVLDIACGYGEFINHIRCATRLAVDLNPAARGYLRPDVRFFHRSCVDLSPITDNSVDVAFESNFFEHLPDKETLRKVVEEVRRKLRPGGRFVMLQPNIRYVGGAYWDFYDHLIPLTDVSCQELLVTSGYEIESVIPRFLPYTTKSRFPQSPALVALYLRFPLAWRLMGKQFLIVARKP
jgi:SAM-dependent methyltransferase